MSGQALTGAWSPYKGLTKDAQKVFKEGILGQVGVDYKPLDYSTQVVNGENFAFFCNASIPGSSETYPAMIDMHRASDTGDVELTGIHRLDH